MGFASGQTQPATEDNLGDQVANSDGAHLWPASTMVLYRLVIEGHRLGEILIFAS